MPDAKITNTAFIDAVENTVANIGWTRESDGTVTLDKDNLAKVEAVQTLSLENKNLTDLSGIEYFTGLTTLYCNNNDLKKLDVSNLKGLVTLNCSSNTNLTELNVAGLPKLRTLRCSTCELTTLNVEGLSNLWELTCTSNNLTSLELSGLNVGTLQCAVNLLETLDISEQTKLMTLKCGSQKESKKLTLIVNSDQMTTWENRWSSGNIEVIPVLKETN